MGVFVIAARVRRVKGTTVHVIRSEGMTLCGKPLTDVIETLELEALPAVDGCRACMRLLEPERRPARAYDRPVFLEPSRGRKGSVRLPGTGGNPRRSRRPL